MRKLVKSLTDPYVGFMIQEKYSDPATIVNSDQIQATGVTGILSGHRPENVNLLGGPHRNKA